MDFKPQIESLLKTLKGNGVDRGQIEEDLGYSENYIDQMLAKGGNKRFLTALQKYALQKAIPSLNGHPADPLPGHATLQDHIDLYKKWLADKEAKYLDSHSANMKLLALLDKRLEELAANLMTGQHQLKEQLFVVGEGLGQQLEGIALGLAAKEKKDAKKDINVSAQKRNTDGKSKGR